MASESIQHVIREKLEPVYGELDLETLLTRWWDDPTPTANDRRKINERTYWVAF